MSDEPRRNVTVSGPDAESRVRTGDRIGRPSAPGSEWRYACPGEGHTGRSITLLVSGGCYCRQCERSYETVEDKRGERHR